MWYYNECDAKTIWPILVSNANNISIASIIFAQNEYRSGLKTREKKVQEEKEEKIRRRGVYE